MQGASDTIIEHQLVHFEKVHPDYTAGAGLPTRSGDQGRRSHALRLATGVKDLQTRTGTGRQRLEPMENGDGFRLVFENNQFLGVIPIDGHPHSHRTGP